MPEAEITLKNTKAEILDALTGALQRAEAAEKGRLNPERAEREKTEKKAVETANKAVEENIFSKELLDRYSDLKLAVSIAEKRLEELYGVERELLKLSLALDAGREKIAGIEAEKTEKSEAARKSLDALRDEYSVKKAELQAEYDADLKKLKVLRERENEEFQYNLKRAREKENNAWADEKSARETALAEREARAARLLEETEAKAEYARGLEEKAAEIPALLEAEREKAKAEATAGLTRDFDFKTQLAQKDAQYAVKGLEDKIASLEKEHEASEKALAALQNKLDKAYAEMKELATKTVEAANGVKILDKAGMN
jgi:hypothetical protein